MRKNALDFSPRGWGRVWLWTTLGTLFCIGVTLYVDSFNFAEYDEPRRLRAILIDVLLPTILAVPMLLFLTSRLRELAIAHDQLKVAASTDSLTGVLNRGAFTTRTDAYLSAMRLSGRQSDGALLVVDADNFKAINDSLGHDQGDEALCIIADTIRACLREGDLVGRLGGEEFGVFLPGLSPALAAAVAERIRASIRLARFPEGAPQTPLSVSIGGATFREGLSFTDLFRLADQQLYAAKQNGRNRIAVSPVTPSQAGTAAA